MKGAAALAFLSLCLAAQAAIAEPAACSPQTVRDGTRILDQGEVMDATISATAIVLGAAGETGYIVSASPQWCKAGEFTVGDHHYVWWHNAAADAPEISGPFDRVTDADVDPNTAKNGVYSLADKLAPTLIQKNGPTISGRVFHIIIETDDSILIAGSYVGPPAPEEIAKFEPGKNFPVDADINKKTNQVKVFSPQ
jgi:hypothetical protein